MAGINLVAEYRCQFRPPANLPHFLYGIISGIGIKDRSVIVTRDFSRRVYACAAFLNLLFVSRYDVMQSLCRGGLGILLIDAKIIPYDFIGQKLIP